MLGLEALEAALEGRVEELSPVAFLGLVLLAPSVYVLFRAVCVHTALAFQGSMKRPFEATLRGIAYSDGSVALLCLVPYGGVFLFLVFGTLVESSALRNAHSLTLRQAVLAVLAPSAILLIAMAARLSLHWIVSS